MHYCIPLSDNHQAQTLLSKPATASTGSMPPPATGWRERLSDMYSSYKGGKFEDNGWSLCALEIYTFLTPARPAPV